MSFTRSAVVFCLRRFVRPAEWARPEVPSLPGPWDYNQSRAQRRQVLLIPPSSMVGRSRPKRLNQGSLQVRISGSLKARSIIY